MAWLILLVLFGIIHDGKLGTIEDMSRLHADLFTRYNKMSRPVKNQEETIVMTMFLNFAVILSLDMKTQVMTTSGWADFIWRDEVLQWNASLYGGIDVIKVSSKKIWIADFLIYNVVEGSRKFGTNDKFLTRITSDGIVQWIPDFLTATSCSIDVTYFPFDTQMCEVQVTSWFYSPEEVILNSSDTLPRLRRLATNGEYEIIASHVRIFANWRSCNLAFGVLLKRKVTFYVMTLILPLMMLSLLCVIGFLVPVQSGERMTVGVTTLLSFTVYIGVIDNNMPKTSDHVSIFVLCVNTLLGLSLLSVLANAAILYLHQNVTQSRGYQRDQSTSRDVSPETTGSGTSEDRGGSATEEETNQNFVKLAWRTQQSKNWLKEKSGNVFNAKKGSVAPVKYPTVKQVNDILAVITASCLGALVIIVIAICMKSGGHVNPDLLPKL